MMKTLLPLLLSVFLLWGCAPQSPEAESLPTASPETPAQSRYGPAPEPVSVTDAVTRFRPSPAATGFLSLEQGLLFFSGEGSTTLTLTDSRTFAPLAEYEMPPGSAALQRLRDGLSYFDDARGATVVLDHTLQEIRQIPAPEGLTGAPLLSADGRQLFYCTADAVRVLDPDTGISRLLKESAYPVQAVSGLLLEDTVLQVSITDTDGSRRTLFLSADTGRLLSDRDGALTLHTGPAGYFLHTREGFLFGAAEGTAMLLHPRQPEAECFFLPESFRVLTAAEEDGNTVLELYDLSTGLRTAAASLPGLHMPEAAAEVQGRLCFLCQGELYQWQPEASSVSDTALYVSAYHTRQAPDYEALARCSLYAQEISRSHGIEVLVYREATEVQPGDYRLEYEYQPSVLMRELESLDRNLAAFPEGFLLTLAESFQGIRICLVQDISGGADVSGLQFFDGYTAYIALNCHEDTRQALFHELSHLMETVVLTQSTAWDRWDSLNPEGFRYGRSPDREWLQPGREWFVDAYAMRSAAEDRARLFEYAMTPGHEGSFRSPPLQDKLRQLCRGLREGFGLKSYDGVLPWEQYLDG